MVRKRRGVISKWQPRSRSYFTSRSELVAWKPGIGEKSSLHSTEFQILAYSSDQSINSACTSFQNVYIDIRQKICTELMHRWNLYSHLCRRLYMTAKTHYYITLHRKCKTNTAQSLSPCQWLPTECRQHMIVIWKSTLLGPKMNSHRQNWRSAVKMQHYTNFGSWNFSFLCFIYYDGLLYIFTCIWYWTKLLECTKTMYNVGAVGVNIYSSQQSCPCRSLRCWQHIAAACRCIIRCILARRNASKSSSISG